MNDKKQCPFCKEPYEKNLKICPHCHYKEPLNLEKALWVFIFLLLPFTIFKFAQEHFEEINFSLSSLTHSKEPSQRLEIKINPISELSGLSKEEILSKRKSYVNNSVVFKDLNYTPNEDVYQIEDYLPWISAEEIVKNGVDNNPNIGVGNSRHSISVNNPELLISFIIPEYKTTNKENFSTSAYLHPQKLFWDKEENTIEAYFDISSFNADYPQYSNTLFYLDETNARDLGYNWVYATENPNVSFKDYNKNIASSIYKIKGYYHKGYSCKLQSGCNNYSPYQEELVFKILDTGHLKIKLWKEKPLSVLQNADITYIMYFE